MKLTENLLCLCICINIKQLHLLISMYYVWVNHCALVSVYCVLDTHCTVKQIFSIHIIYHDNDLLCYVHR